jgi:hypothetical protein
MLAQFTHTGVGVAENKEGDWYVTQIYVTTKQTFSEGDRVILAGRFVNGIRREAGVGPLSISLAASLRLREAPLQHPGFSPKDDWVDYSTFDLQILRFERKFKGKSEMELIFDEYLQRRDFVKMAKSAGYVEFAFASRVGPGNLMSVAFLLGRGGAVERVVRARDLKYPEAAVMLGLINAFRADKMLRGFVLSHRWCVAAERHVAKVLGEGQELEVRSLKTRIAAQLGGSDVETGAALIPRATDPLGELFLVWITNDVSVKQILGNATHFAFALGGMRGGGCAAVRVLGIRDGKGEIAEQVGNEWMGIARFADAD